MEASPQQSMINGACGAGASIAVCVRLLWSWRHNTLQLTNAAEHRQDILMSMDFNNAPLLRIYVNGKQWRLASLL